MKWIAHKGNSFKHMFITRRPIFAVGFEHMTISILSIAQKKVVKGYGHMLILYAGIRILAYANTLCRYSHTRIC